jgi:hypothetical protein
MEGLMSQRTTESIATKTSRKQGRASDTTPPMVQLVSPRRLRPNPRNARTHSQAQIAQIVASIQSAGFINPVIADTRRQNFRLPNSSAVYGQAWSSGFVQFGNNGWLQYLASIASCRKDFAPKVVKRR